MQLTSTAFQNIETIPVRYTGEGQDISPPLIWSALPTGTHSLALICEDPDAPMVKGKDYPFVHWVLFNLDPAVGMLPEGMAPDEKITEPVSCEQGFNSWERAGYGGPLPPVGHGQHRYFFRLFALSRFLELPPQPRKAELLKAMEGAILGTTVLLGTYERTSEETAFPAA